MIVDRSLPQPGTPTPAEPDAPTTTSTTTSSPPVVEADPLRQLFRRNPQPLSLAHRRSLQSSLRQRLFAGEDDKR